MKKESVAIINALILFNTLLIIYLSAIETLVCPREMSLIGSTSFSFEEITIQDYQRPPVGPGQSPGGWGGGARSPLAENEFVCFHMPQKSSP